MNALLLQTLLLTVPAFFIGAALACGLRKLLHPVATVAAINEQSVPGPVAPMPQYAPQARQREMPSSNTVPSQAAAAPATAKPAPEAIAPSTANIPATGNRFDDTLKARPVEPARPAPPPPAAPVAQKPALVTEPPASLPSTSLPSTSPATASVAKAGVANESAPAPAAARIFTSKSDIVDGTAAVAAATAAAIAVANVATSAATAATTASKPFPGAPPVAAAPSTLVVPLARDTVVPTSLAKDNDDLTRISMIDPALSTQLAGLGVTRFSQISAWRKADIDSISQALGFQGRIERENWIEQAQILTTGNETHYSSQRTKVRAAMAAAPDVRSSQIPVEDTPPSAMAKSPETPVPTLTPRVEERAAFTSAPASAAAPAPSSAAVIAAAAASAAASAASMVAPPPPPAPKQPAAPLAPAVAIPEVRPAAPPVAETTPVAVAVRPVMAPTRDALQRIGSINAEVERLLGAQGVTRYNQIAGWGPAETERFDRLLGSQGRISRENWVEQAQILAKGGDTTYSRDFDRRAAAPAASAAPTAPPVPAARPAVQATPSETAARPMNITDAIRANAGAAGARADIAGLRSVRSDAYRAPAETARADTTGKTTAVETPKLVRSAEVDDLKRIRGIGVLIEKRLNSIGIVSYSQIADWTNDDIGRVSATLDFQGRIERENWVEQARILAAGGETEFSRRVKLGEVETPKAR